MISAAEFKKKYSKFVTKGEACYKDERSLSESRVHQNRCIKMLAHVLEVDETSRRRFVVGNKDLYHAFGIGGTYCLCAVNTVYETILFYLENGWWLIGFDKAELVQGKFKLGGYVFNYKESEERSVIAYRFQDRIVACIDSFHYTIGLLRSPLEAFDIIRRVERDYTLKLGNYHLKFESAEMIGSGFSSVDPVRLIQEIQKNS